MKTLNFRGEINNMSAGYFCREMETLPARSAATIYLYTPGGDIYAGGEMINAMRAACKRGCKIDLELGSRVASMGAAFLAAARAEGCKVKAHANSEAIFHGCWSILMGGADELTDQAKALRDFNECVKRDLKKCGVEDTDEWFAADRQKCLNAQEMKDFNLVDSIVEDEAVDIDLKSDAVKIAAKLNHKEIPSMDELNENPAVAPEEAAAVETPNTEEAVSTIAPTAEPTEQAAEPTAPAEAEAAPTAEDVEAKAMAMANERFAKLQAKHDKMICGLTKERDVALTDLESAKAEAISLKASIEKLNGDLAALRDQLAKSEQIRKDVVVAALTPDDDMKDGWSAKWRTVKGRQY